MREVPRDVHGERSRSDDQEDRGTDDRGGALHDRSIPNAAANCADRASAGVVFNFSDGRELRTSNALDLRRVGAAVVHFATPNVVVNGGPLEMAVVSRGACGPSVPPRVRSPHDTGSYRSKVIDSLVFSSLPITERDQSGFQPISSSNIYT